MRPMLKIRSKDIRYVAALALAATIVMSAAIYTILNPPPSEQFLAIWLLGSTGLAENYYPNGNPNLRVGDQISWTLGVFNHMGALEYVVVQVKLLNATAPGPDDINATPSPVPPLLKFSRVLVDNETWTVPVQWIILNAIRTGRSITITGLSINGIHLNGTLATAPSGYNFHLVFELWLYEQNDNSLVFFWKTYDLKHDAWTQIWFNVTGIS